MDSAWEELVAQIKTQNKQCDCNSDGERQGIEAGKQCKQDSRPILEDTAACRALASIVEYLNINHGKHVLNEMKRQMPHIRDTLVTAEVINRRGFNYVKPDASLRVKPTLQVQDMFGDDVCGDA